MAHKPVEGQRLLGETGAQSGSELDEEQGNAQEKTEKNVYKFSISILNSELVQLRFRPSAHCC